MSKTAKADLDQQAMLDPARAARRICIDPAWDLIGRMFRGEDLSKPRPEPTRQERAIDEWVEKPEPEWRRTS